MQAAASQRFSLIDLRLWTLREWACLLLPALMIPVSIGGQLLIAEPLLFGFAVLLIATDRTALPMLQDRRVMVILALAGLWFLNQVMTDLVRGTDTQDLVRGWAKIGFFLSNFVALILLTQFRTRNVLLMLAGLVAGLIVFKINGAGLLFTPLDWKMGWSQVCGFGGGLIAAWLCYRGRWMTAAAILFGLGMFSFFMNARSAAGFFMVTAGFTVYVGHFPKTHPKFAFLQFACLTVCALIGFQMLMGLYSAGASSGLFGEEAQAKYRMQTANEAGNVFASGRLKAWEIAGDAIAESPVIGHGSWYQDRRFAFASDEVRNQLRSRSQLMRVDWDSYAAGKVRGHSFILSAWVEAGVFGAMFWTAIFGLGLWTIYRLANTRHFMAPLAGYASMYLLWAILFSPFGMHQRLIVAGIIVFFLFLLTDLSRQRSGPGGLRLEPR